MGCEHEMRPIFNVEINSTMRRKASQCRKCGNVERVFTFTPPDKHDKIVIYRSIYPVGADIVTLPIEYQEQREKVV